MYKGGKAPPAGGVQVPGMNSCAPVYRYGWLVSRAELYEAMNGKPHTLDVWLREIDDGLPSPSLSHPQEGLEPHEHEKFSRWLRF